MSPSRKRRTSEIRRWELPSQNFLDGLKNTVDQLPNVPGFDRHTIFLIFVYSECFRGKIVRLTIPAEQQHLIRECMRLRDHYYPELKSSDTLDELGLLNVIRKRVCDRIYDQENTMLDTAYEEMAEHDVETGQYRATRRRPLLNPADINLGDEILNSPREEINDYMNSENYEEDVGEIMDYLDAPLGTHEFDMIIDGNQNSGPPDQSRAPIPVRPERFAPMKTMTDTRPNQEQMDFDAGSDISAYEPADTPSPVVSDPAGSPFQNDGDQVNWAPNSAKRLPPAYQTEPPPPKKSKKRSRAKPVDVNQTPLLIDEGATAEERASSTTGTTVTTPSNSKENEADMDVVKVEPEEEEEEEVTPTRTSPVKKGVELKYIVNVTIDECFNLLVGEEPEERARLAKAMGAEIEKRHKSTWEHVEKKEFSFEEGGIAKRLGALFELHDRYFAPKHRAVACKPCSEAFVTESDLARHAMQKKHLRRIALLPKMHSYTAKRVGAFDYNEAKRTKVIAYIQDPPRPPVKYFKDKDFGGISIIIFAEVVEAYKQSLEAIGYNGIRGGGEDEYEEDVGGTTEESQKTTEEPKKTTT